MYHCSTSGNYDATHHLGDCLIKVLGGLVYGVSIATLVVLSGFISTPPIESSQDSVESEIPTWGSFEHPFGSTLNGPAGVRANCAHVYERRSAAERNSGLDIPEPTVLPADTTSIRYMVRNAVRQVDSACQGGPDIQISIASEEGDVIVDMFIGVGENMTEVAGKSPIILSSGYIAQGSRHSKDGRSDINWDAEGYMFSLSTGLDLDRATEIAGGLRP